MKTIYYWSPSLTNVATNRAVINSAISIKKFSISYEPIIIDVSGEFSYYKEELEQKNIKIKKLYFFNYHKILPKNGFLKSRISYLIIIIMSFIPLLYLLKIKKPDFLIIHLITSLPLIILLFLKINTKIILRISGLPKLTYFRKNLWHKSINIRAITCPTEGTLKNLLNSNIFPAEKIFLLRDPVIDIKIISKNKNQLVEFSPGYLIAIGRLTKQKNFIFLINSISDFLNINRNIKLIILGEGEEQKSLQKIINNLNLENQIFLLGYQKNVFSYLSCAKLLISTSLWEDPGFVILEAIALNIPVLSSDCENGPSEILKNGSAGYLYKSNDKIDFLKNLNLALNENYNKLFLKKVIAKKNSRQFTKLLHYKQLYKILNY